MGTMAPAACERRKMLMAANTPGCPGERADREQERRRLLGPGADAPGRPPGTWPANGRAPAAGPPATGHPRWRPTRTAGRPPCPRWPPMRSTQPMVSRLQASNEPVRPARDHQQRQHAGLAGPVGSGAHPLRPIDGQAGGGEHHQQQHEAAPALARSGQPGAARRERLRSTSTWLVVGRHATRSPAEPPGNDQLDAQRPDRIDQQRPGCPARPGHGGWRAHPVPTPRVHRRPGRARRSTRRVCASWASGSMMHASVATPRRRSPASGRTQSVSSDGVTTTAVVPRRSLPRPSTSTSRSGVDPSAPTAASRCSIFCRWRMPRSAGSTARRMPWASRPTARPASSARPLIAAATRTAVSTVEASSRPTWTPRSRSRIDPQVGRPLDLELLDLELPVTRARPPVDAVEGIRRARTAGPPSPAAWSGSRARVVRATPSAMGGGQLQQRQRLHPRRDHDGGARPDRGICLEQAQRVAGADDHGVDAVVAAAGERRPGPTSSAADPGRRLRARPGMRTDSAAGLCTSSQSFGRWLRSRTV